MHVKGVAISSSVGMDNMVIKVIALVGIQL